MSEPDGGGQSWDLPRLARLAVQVVAPVTVLTALLFFFGWARGTAMFGYFGLNPTVLGFGTSDYLVLAQDALLLPLVVVSVAVLLGAWCALVVPGPFRWLATRRWFGPAVLGAGLLLLANGLLGLVGAAPFDAVAVAPLSLIVGVLLVAWVVRGRAPSRTDAHRRARALEFVAVSAVTVLGLFWATSDYASAVGRERAREIVAGLGTSESVVLYSARSLAITGPSVAVTECAGADPAYRFRYSGLRLLVEVEDQYVLLPLSWTPRDGSAYVVPPSGDVRLDVRPPGAVDARQGPC